MPMMFCPLSQILEIQTDVQLNHLERQMSITTVQDAISKGSDWIMTENVLP